MEDEDDDDISPFLEWLHSNHFNLHPNIQLCDIPDSGRGLIALANINEGETLFQVPKDQILGCGTSQALNVMKPVGQYALDNLERLIIVLMYELGLGCKSHWYAYLQLLPEKMGTPLFWNKEQILQLQGSRLKKVVQRDRQESRECYARLKKLLKRLCRKGYLLKEHTTLKSFKRLGSIIRAYGFSDGESEDSICLVPMADMLNHGVFGNNAFLFNGNEKKSKRGEKNNNDNGFQVRATRRIRKGEQIFNSYGDMSNAQCLLRYGFTVDGNPNDVFEISLSWLWNRYLRPKDDAANHRALQTLKSLIILDDGDAESTEDDPHVMAVTMQEVATTAIPIELRVMARVSQLPTLDLGVNVDLSQLDEEEYDVALNQFLDDTDELVSTSSSSRKLHRITTRKMLKALKKMESKYPDSLEATEAKLQQVGMMNKHEADALTVRVGELRILTTLQQTIQFGPKC